MDKVLGAAIALLIIVVALLAMYRAWRARERGGSTFVLSTTDVGLTRCEAEVFYVATTRADNYLERIALPGFAYRGYGHVLVGQRGLKLELASGEQLTIDESDFLGAMLTTTVIDKVVEKDGLVSLRWRASRTNGEVFELATHLRVPRIEQRDELLVALKSLSHTTQKEGTL